MKTIISKDCFRCSAIKATHGFIRTFPENDGKGGLTIKKEYVCSSCGESFITEM